MPRTTFCLKILFMFPAGRSLRSHQTNLYGWNVVESGPERVKNTEDALE